MTFAKTLRKLPAWGRGALLVVGGLTLGACASVDNTANSKLTQPVDANGTPIIQAGDVVIAGQDFSHSILDLPQVADAEKPPLVRFEGVTSIINGPVDTAPYTDLLRDRLLLITRLKLRFVERTLPPYHAHKVKSNKDLPPPMDVDSDADYEVKAELRGNYDDDHYRIQIQFLDLQNNQVLFNGLYDIRKELQSAATGETTVTNQRIEPTNPQGPVTPVDLRSPPPPGNTAF